MSLGLIASFFFGALSYFKINAIPMPVHFSFFSFVISVAALVVVSMVTTKTSEQVLD
jgi:SSS family solute:Na+ symporter